METATSTIDLDARAMLLIAEVAIAESTLRDALAAALALDEDSFDRSAIIFDGGNRLNPLGILAFAQANDLKADNRSLAA